MGDYRALYRKWRPATFDEVCGQKATTDILKYEVSNGKISHAYLFCGSRGTGKTSCAKILAKAVNCLDPKDGNPCNCCDACRSIDNGTATDVIEMDAASNNGVNNVRDMKDEIAFTPAELKYRVYIIDEVHMMTGSAFNALLKTLEEPPEYVVFILATTEFHKLPTTIVSRCQRFDFRRMTGEVIVGRLKTIAEAEGINLTDGGAAVIARAAEGGMRDAVSLLELASGGGAVVDEERVIETVGRGSRSSSYNMIDAILSQNYSAVYKAVFEAVSLGSDITVFWQELMDAYRDLLVVKCTKDAPKYLDLTDGEYEILKRLSKNSTVGKLLYHTSVLENAFSSLQRAKESKRSIAEIALTKMCDKTLEVTPEALLSRVEELEATVARMKHTGFTQVSEQSNSDIDFKEEIPVTEESETAAALESGEVSSSEFNKWRQVVKEVEVAKASLKSPLSKAVALKNSDGSYTIKIDPFFVRIVGDSRENLAIIKGLIAEAEGASPEGIKLTVVPKSKDEAPTLADEIENALK